MNIFKRSKSITTRELAVFFRQFATLIAAGIPIINVCTMLAASQNQINLKLLISAVKQDLLSGKTLALCLARHPEHIDKFLYHLIHISEQTGKLDCMLQIVAEHLEKKLALREQVQRALFYPCIVAIAGISITLIMLVFIVPRFAELFKDLPNSLPPLTQAIFGLSKLVRHSLWGTLLLPFIAYLLKPYLMKRPLSHFPLFKNHFRSIQLARFTRNLATTLNAGIPISHALTLAGEPCEELYDTLKRLERQVRSGIPLYRAMSAFPCFTPLVIQMTKTGEEAGQLDALLFKAADILDGDIERKLNRFSQLLEPLIMIILGVLIGGLVTGMYLPIFKLGSII